ncbi:MAG: sodium-dependent transporter, partial [Baileyella intestinalis]|nr:sodium-dependent transporter [Baileyella intestinalis]
AAFATCLLVVKGVGLDQFSSIVKETSGFRREALFRVFVKYVAPVFLLVIFASSVASAFGLFSL